MSILPLALIAYFLFLSFVLGLCMGSFLNCMAWRLVHGESVWKGRSHCATCNHPLSALDLVPFFSYLFLKGRCRYCKDPIALRYPATEVLCGVLFLSITVTNGFTVDTVRMLLFACILLVATLTDLDSMEIPDRLHVAAIVLWLVMLPLSPLPRVALFSGLIGGFSIAVPLLLVVLLAEKVLQREAMGGGDLKLIFVTGLYFGVAENLLLLILACVVGLVFAFVARAKEKQFPFAPSIAVAAWLVMLVGNPITRWYLSLF